MPDFEVLYMVVHPSDKNASINSYSEAIEDMVESMPANLNRSNKYAEKNYIGGKLGLGLNLTQNLTRLIW